MGSLKKNFGFRMWLLPALAVLILGCGSRPAGTGGKVIDRLADVKPASAASVVMFCGDCHVPPDPQTFPKGHWAVEVQRGFDFYEKSGRHDLFPPSQDSVLKYYLSVAPEQLEVPRPVETLMTGPLTFKRQPIADTDGGRMPGVSHILAKDNKFYACDMLSGGVSSVTFDDLRNPQVELLAKVKAPTHVDRVDLLDEGQPGLLIADIGELTPEDHQLGGVYYFPASALGHSEGPSPGKSSSRLDLLVDVGRVADAKAADLDGDGSLEVVVAIFGYHETGSLDLLRRIPGSDQFQRTTLDERHGASHILMDDLDMDGDLDLIVLHSQEFESVDAYLNDGKAKFKRVELFAGPVPDFGCSSIEIADLDADGDTDIVVTNGDSMDSNLPKPHHGIRWLENTSQLDVNSQHTTNPRLRFTEHLIAPMVGCYGADIGDLDGDGDLDIVACAMIWDDSTVNSVVWFEQQAGCHFVKHCLDLSLDQHPCIELGDFDRDGDLDIALGEFNQFIPLEAWTSVWWNEGLNRAALQQDELGIVE